MKVFRKLSMAAILALAGVAAHAQSTYTVGGSISGLPSGATLTLSDTNAGSVTLGDGSYTLPNGLATGAAYSVAFAAASVPSGYSCTVANGSGTIASANVTNVNALCVQNTTTTTSSSSPPSVFGSLTGMANSNDVAVTDPWGNKWDFTAPSVTDASGNVIASGSQVSVETTPMSPKIVAYQISFADPNASGNDIYLDYVLFGCRPDLGQVLDQCSGGMSFEWDSKTGDGGWKLVSIVDGKTDATYVNAQAVTPSDYTASLATKVTVSEMQNGQLATKDFPLQTPSNFGLTMTSVLSTWPWANF